MDGSAFIGKKDKREDRALALNQYTITLSIP